MLLKNNQSWRLVQQGAAALSGRSRRDQAGYGTTPGFALLKPIRACCSGFPACWPRATHMEALFWGTSRDERSHFDSSVPSPPLPCHVPRGQAFLRGLQVLQVNSCISPQGKSSGHCYDSPDPSCNKLNQQNTTRRRPWGSTELPWSEASSKETGISVVPERDKLPFIWRMFCFPTLKWLNLHTRSLRATRF